MDESLQRFKNVKDHMKVIGSLVSLINVCVDNDCKDDILPNLVVCAGIMADNLIKKYNDCIDDVLKNNGHTADEIKQRKDDIEKLVLKKNNLLNTTLNPNIQ